MRVKRAETRGETEMIVKIPFLERFREPMLNGIKTMTSRTKKYGEKGDWFDAFGATFRIDLVEKSLFQTIANIHWKDEGCSSYEDFLAVWKQIHPRREIKDCDEFWVHSFHKVGSRKA